MQIKNLIKLSVLSCFLLTNSCFGADLTNDFNQVFANSKVQKGGVSISIKTLDKNPETAYELNSTTLVPPASLQKIITTLPAIETLGKDYKFTTELYKNAQGDYIIKLGADPYLQSKDLKTLTRNMPAEVKSISIDDSIMDKKEWGEGWQWDDELNPCMPKFSAYNIDRNMIKVFVEPTQIECPANIILGKDYPITVINHITTGNSNNFSFRKETCEGVDVLMAEGTVAKLAVVDMPIKSPKKNFKLRLADALIDNSKSNNGVYNNAVLTSDYVLVDKITHDISLAKNDILKNSDNFVAETTFKLAGGKYRGKSMRNVDCTCSFEDGKEMFEDYCKRNGLNVEEICIVDASGVSKNNLMMTNFMTDFLIINKSELEPIMATSGEGTLTNRLLYLRGNLKAKTGTLSNVSGLAGYVSSQNGHKYAFTIIITDPKSSNNDKKLLEDNIIKTLYIKG